MSGLMGMALDDIIKQKQTGRGRGHRQRRGTNNRFVPKGTRGGGSSYGVFKRTSRGTGRRGPYGGAQKEDSSFSEETVWEHDLFEEEDEEEELEEEEVGHVGGGRRDSIQTGVKVTVTNLEYSVSEKDLTAIMGRAGTVKRANIHYDRSGRSEGTADVFFATRNDAIAAVKQYNGVEIDGKVVRLGLDRGDQSSNSPSGLVVSARIGRNTRITRPVRGSGGRGRGFGGGRGRGRGSRGGFRGGRKSFGEKVTAESLDKELESYNNMND